MSNLYDLPKDLLIKLISEIEEKTRFDEKLKFYQKLSELIPKWYNYRKFIVWIKEDAKTPSEYLRIIMSFGMDKLVPHMTIEELDKYLLPNIKNASGENIYRHFDYYNYTYCDKCNSLYLGKGYECCNEL